MDGLRKGTTFGRGEVWACCVRFSVGAGRKLRGSSSILELGRYVVEETFLVGDVLSIGRQGGVKGAKTGDEVVETGDFGGFPMSEFC